MLLESNNSTVNKLIEDGISGYRVGMNRLVSNYIKRRNVGFTIKESAIDSWSDLKGFYKDLFTGKEHRDLKEPFVYMK